MPILKCRQNGKPGFRVENTNGCHTYEPGDLEDRERARNKAERQLAAIKANQNRNNN